MFAKGGISDKNEAFTLRYAAPELILSDNSRSHPSLDVWTIGIMLYAMLFNLMPFNGTTKE
jgi:non-specific serine/threonine protein kinase